MIDQATLQIHDLGIAVDFYMRTLAPLGYAMVAEHAGRVAFGIDGKPILWIAQRTPLSQGIHLAFVTERRTLVDAFHAAALAAGGLDACRPGIQTDRHPHYYAARVLDPDNNSIEAVCHDPRG